MQLVKQVILLINHKILMSPEQSQIFRELSNNLFNELKLPGSSLSLLLMKLYLETGFFFFCGWESFFLLSLAERFLCRLGLKGRVKKSSHLKSPILSRGSLYCMTTSFIAKAVTAHCRMATVITSISYSSEYKAQGILSTWSQVIGSSFNGQKLVVKPT